MKVRLAVDEDLKELARMGLFLKWQQEECGFDGYVDNQDYIEAWAKFLVLTFGDGRHVMIVVEDDDGKVVGGLIGCVFPTELMYKERLLGHILFIWVDPDARGKDYARGLVQAFEDEMKARDINTIFGTIYHNNFIPQKGLKERGYSLEFVQLYKEI